MMKITDLIPDDKNFNKGSETGKFLLDKSFGKFGAGRSILIDKNNKVIAGNKSLEAFAELGLDKVQIIETDGKTLVAVKRTDIDLDTQEGREMALADNQTAIKSINIDVDLVEEELGIATSEDWFVDSFGASEDVQTDAAVNVNSFSDESSLILRFTPENYLKVIGLLNAAKLHHNCKTNEELVLILLSEYANL